MEIKPVLMTTFTGFDVNPLNLKREDIDVRDIAHALALCSRFAGHSRFPISVAQHSVGVSLLAGAVASHREALQGLFHDGSEAYLGDMTKWVKSSPEMSGYRDAEHRAQTVVYTAFGLPIIQADSVSQADRTMVRLEFEIAFNRGQVIKNYGALNRHEYKKAVDEVLIPSGLWRPHMTWEEAETAFLVRWRDLNRDTTMF